MMGEILTNAGGNVGAPARGGSSLLSTVHGVVGISEHREAQAVVAILFGGFLGGRGRCCGSLFGDRPAYCYTGTSGNVATVLPLVAKVR